MITRCLSNITLGLLALTLLSGSLLISSHSSAEDSGVDNVSITIPVTCTMVGTGMNSHTATIENGTYRGDDVNGIGIGETTLKAYCNDTSGFSIYAIGYTNEEYGNTVLKSTTLGDTYNIITGTNTGPVGSTDISNWSMKLKAVSGTYTPTIENGFSNYSNVPTTYTKVATKASGTDMGSNAEGSSIKSTYAAYISKTQPSDTYEGKVKYTLVHPANEEPAQPVPCEPGKICYNANTALAQGQMGKQELIKARDWSSCYYTDYSTACFNEDLQQIDINTLPELENYADVILYAPNYARSGYGFVGWNTEPDYSGTDYGPNQTISVSSDAETYGLPLYARWVKTVGSMQSFTTGDCAAMSTNSVSALTDDRDNNTYAIAKLADNKCWMIENLRLDDSAELSQTNTNNPSLPLTNVYDTNSKSNHLSPTSSVAYDAQNAPEGWCSDSQASCGDQSRLRTDNTTLFTNNLASNYDAESNVYSYGNSYNWYSATAGNGTHDMAIGNTNGDLCPSNWHLPTGGNTSAEFAILDIAMGGSGVYQNNAEASNKWRTYPNNFILSGRVHESSAHDFTRYEGFYWASTKTNTGNLNDQRASLSVSNTDVHPTTLFNAYFGQSIRCIAGP